MFKSSNFDTINSQGSDNVSKKKLAIFLTGAIITTSGISVSVNRQKSKELIEHITSYTTSMTDDDFQIAAHRGFSSKEVENTQQALQLAAEQNYIDSIEMDARMTDDQRIVITHNNRHFRNINETQYISTSTYEEAISSTYLYENEPFSSLPLLNIPEAALFFSRKHHLNHQKYKIIGLLEAIHSCGPKKILLDLKITNNYEEFTEELKRELQGIDCSNIMFMSLNLSGLRYLQEHSNFNCLALIDSNSDFAYIHDFQNIGFKFSLLTHERIKRYICEKKHIAVWTINSSKDLNTVTEEADDYYQNLIYITDYPDLIATKLHDKQKTKETNQ